MLRVKTYLAPSKILGAGNGLYAAEAIKKDTIIWAYDPLIDRIYTEQEFKSFDEPIIKTFLNTYCFKFNGKYCLCVDNARFFNHSEDANCYSSDFSEEYMGYTRAKRDIEQGEELTDNYSKMGLRDTDQDFNMAL